MEIFPLSSVIPVPSYFLSYLTIFATEICKCIETALFGKVCSTGSGTEIYALLSIIVQILTYGIGIVATIGIIIFGIQYLTASSNEAKVKTAKKRIFSITIGLVAYVLAYNLLSFILPNFNPNFSKGFETCVETEQNPAPGSSSVSTTDPESENPDVAASSRAEKIAATGIMMAWPYSDPVADGANVGKCKTETGRIVLYGSYQARCGFGQSNYDPGKCCANSLKPQNATVLTANGIKPNNQLSYAKDCGKFVGAVIKYSDVDPNFPERGTDRIDSYLKRESAKSNGKWTQVTNKGSTKKLQPGDILVYPSNRNYIVDGQKVTQYGHVMIYVGDKSPYGNMVEAALSTRVARTTSAPAGLSIRLQYSKEKVKYHIYRIRE